MADNDDDDDFGEFTFAPIQSTLNSSSQVPLTTGGDNDDWGDFKFFQNNATDHNVNSSSPSQPPPPKWEKIKGALPLSIFGDEEQQGDMDEKSVMPVVGNDVKQSNFSGTSGFVSDTSSHRNNAHIGINDLIADLYGQRQQQQEQSVTASDTGNELDFSALTSTVSKDPVSELNSLSSFSLNTVSADVVNQGSDDEGGWEFIDAFSDSKLGHNEKDHKELSENTVSSLGLQGGSHGHIGLFAAPNNGFFVESHVTDSGFDSKPITNFQNGFVDIKADSKGTTHELSSNTHGGSDDFDDTFGEFEAAFVENSSVKKVDLNMPELSEERFDPLGSHDKSHGSVDLFSFSNEAPIGSHVENNGFDFSHISQTPVVENGFALDETEWKETKDDSDLKHPDVGADDESFGRFETTFQESGSKPEGFGASKKNFKEPVPLSIFGIEEDPKADNSLNLEHELFKSSTHGTHKRNLSSNLSINDILSDLYSQARLISSDGKEDLPHSIGKEYGSLVADDNDNKNDDDNDNDDDDSFNEGSWEFKEASSESRVGNKNLSFEKKLNNCINLYSNLKDDLSVVARLHSLKKAQSNTTLVGEEMKVGATNKEIQEALEKLHQKDISTEMDLDDHSESVISLKSYIETFKEPDFEILESEYQLSRRLLLAESDLATVVDLINHFTTVLKILTLTPKGEPADYVSLWFKVISVSFQELNHGTWIWKQSVEKNVHSEILSEKQGRQFITALGEIYRAVMILEAAVKFYKPWILLSGADLEGIYGLLKECHSLWSTSGLEASIPADYLLESIRHIQNLDEIAIADTILSQEESQCGLSLLSPGVVPELKMVTWNEDKYFVTLANLWANLISPDPPKLSIHVG